LNATGNGLWSGKTVYTWKDATNKVLLEGIDQKQLAITEGNDYAVTITNYGSVDTRNCKATSVPFTIAGFFFDDQAEIVSKGEALIADLRDYPYDHKEMTIVGSPYAGKVYASADYGVPSYNWSVETKEKGNSVVSGATTNNVVVDMFETAKIYYTVKYYNCESTTEAPLVVYPRIAIPEVFTPNGDGIYDVWDIVGLEAYPKAKVDVFNRWGTKVYSSQGAYTKAWEGTSNNGNNVSDGVYFYTIDLFGTGKNGIQGNVTVLR
jgi:gliding motility-associated-like protein